jgi:holo-[acyl-carrier protein] synthase
MIIGIGIDVMEVPRFEQALQRHGERLLNRLFTPGERAYCQSKARAVEHFAARFCAKEAGMKALGTGKSGGITWRDVEVVRVPGQKPQLQFHGAAQQRFAKLGAQRVHVTLTHTGHTAMAQVIIED